MIQYIADAHLPTEYGNFIIYGFQEQKTKQDIVILTCGEITTKEDVLVRIHSKCLTGDAFHSLKCDCHAQLDYALQRIGKEGGILIYLDQEGRGIGILNKIKAYKLQEQGYDTLEANEQLGLPVDDRHYDVVHDILQYFDIISVKLLTNNPLKVKALSDVGIKVTREKIILPENIHSKKYFETKRYKMNHLL